jgi:tetratricopeptide (TPR) repeat protein
LKQYEQVLKLCKQILSTNSKDVWALNSMGLSLNELNRHQEALEYYEKSLEIDLDDVTALMNKAISLSHLGNYKDAIEFYDKAQTIDSSLKEASIVKSQLFEKLGMKDDAFLAAQGVLNKEMEKIKTDAKENKCSVFHQFCEDEYEKYDSK